jgi:hypothetical protein
MEEAMSLRSACSAAAVVVITVGVVTLSYAQRRDGGFLPPEKSGRIIVAGCLVRGADVGSVDDDEYVLARPTIGLDSVTEATCSVDAGADALELEDGETFGIDDSMLGHWVEVTGNLEQETSKNPNNLRELEIRSFRMVPVVPRRAAAEPVPARPAPPIAQERPIAPPPAAVSEPAPVATTGEVPQSLPKTASPVPAIGLLGLLSLAGGLILRSFRLRESD